MAQVIKRGGGGGAPYSPPASRVDHFGDYNAATNVPPLTDAGGMIGDKYRVSAPGQQDFGSGPLELVVDQEISHNGTKWYAVPAGSDTSQPPVRITKAGHGLTLGQAVHYERDLSDVVATHSGEDRFNGIVCNVVDLDNVDVCVPYQGPFTWTAHGFTDPYLHVGTQAQGGSWQPAIVGDYPVAGLLVIDADTVYPIAIPRVGVAVPIVVATTAEMDTNERFYRLSANDGGFNAGIYYRTGDINTLVVEL